MSVGRMERDEFRGCKPTKPVAQRSGTRPFDEARPLRAKKGIFITTSGYNQNAIEFAQTVPQKVILIDGHRLANLMIEHNVGVSTEQVISIKRLDTDYFED